MDDVDIYGDLLPPQPKAPAKAVSSSVPDPRLADPGETAEHRGAGTSAHADSRPFRPRARNLVWKAPGVESPAVTRKEAQVPKDTEPEVVVLDDADPPKTQPAEAPPAESPPAESPPASEPPAQSPAPAVAAVAEAMAEPKPKEFATLQKELQAEEAWRPNLTRRLKLGRGRSYNKQRKPTMLRTGFRIMPASSVRKDRQRDTNTKQRDGPVVE